MSIKVEWRGAGLVRRQGYVQGYVPGLYPGEQARAVCVIVQPDSLRGRFEAVPLDDVRAYYGESIETGDGAKVPISARPLPR